MKITREGARIIIEVELADCQAGMTPEMTASLMMEGVEIGKKHSGEIMHIMSPALQGDLDRAQDDFNERWER